MEKIIQGLEQINPQADFKNNLGLYLTLINVDVVLSKIKAKDKVKTAWENKYKARKLKELKEQVNEYKRLMQAHTSHLNHEETLIDVFKIDSASQYDQMVKYTFIKNHYYGTLKHYWKTQELLRKAQTELMNLELNYDYVSLDSKTGKFVYNQQDYSQSIQGLINLLQANSLTPLTYQKLQAIIQQNNQEQDDQDVFTQVEAD